MSLCSRLWELFILLPTLTVPAQRPPALTKPIGSALLSLISRLQQLETIVQPVGMPTEMFAVSSIERARAAFKRKE
jgi:hypothetical protein